MKEYAIPCRVSFLIPSATQPADRHPSSLPKVPAGTFALALLLAAAGCSQRGAAGPAPGGAGLLKGVRVSQMSSNASNWTLEAKTARLEESETRIFFEEPRLTFFENDEVASELAANTGFLDLAEKDAELEKNVVVVSKTERMTLLTEKVFYSSGKNRIWSDEAVTVLRGKNEMRGSGFTANPDLSEIEISRAETKVNQPSDIKSGRAARKAPPARPGGRGSAKK